MQRLFALVCFSLFAIGQPARLGAHRDAGLPAARAPAFELVVFEAEGCIYCQSLRRDVAPLYRESTLHRDAPMRFVNLTYADETKMGLTYAISIAPTVVLMQEGREVNRIEGYTGPFNFLTLVRHMMGRGE